MADPRENTEGFQRCKKAVAKFGLPTDMAYAPMIETGLTILLLEQLEEVAKKLDQLQVNH